ncbi:MAG TPA: hypothetical protein G4O08_06345 [Anaerolineae bacterium]|nr:hypothetical protein [Anaerolineae bacterium]
MIQQRKYWPIILAAVLMVSCTCSLLSSGPRLADSRSAGGMTVHFPDDWYSEREDEILVFSPEPIGDFFDMEPQPAFIAVSGYLDDWVSEGIRDADDLLDEIADEIRAGSVGRTDTVEGDDITWLRATAEGDFDIFDRSVTGWIAVTLQGNAKFAFVLAVAPDHAWDEYENIFEAMLEKVELN